jgi:hypothetical protein
MTARRERRAPTPGEADARKAGYEAAKAQAVLMMRGMVLGLAVRNVDAAVIGALEVTADAIARMEPEA